MKRLNNKGFTLIELLAVIVILAVVMTIAASTVIGSMNNARGGTLVDSSKVIARDFVKKYVEAQVSGSVSNVEGYDFSTNRIAYLNETVAGKYDLSANDYYLESGSTVTNVTAAVNGVAKSFIQYNATTGKFIVCLVAKETGSVYVASFKKNNVSLVTTPYSMKTNANYMVGCSNDAKTW